MIQRLRRKFTLLATGALFVVIATILGAIMCLTYSQARNEVSNVLTVLIENDGELVNKQGLANARHRFGPNFHVESMFQYRYFAATVNKHGQVTITSDSHIWTINGNDINNLCQQALDQSRGSKDWTERFLYHDPKRGVIDYQGSQFGFRVAPQTNGTKLIAFIDQTPVMDTVHDLFHVGALICLIGLVLFAIILWLISGVAVRPLVENDRRQKQFITNAGHELKTPLAVISANNEMQEMMNGSDEWTQSNGVQIKRLTWLITRLINIARLGENPSMELRPVDASQKVNEIAESFDAVAKADNKTLQTEVAPHLWVSADERYFAELVNIQLDNAVKYCDDKGQITVQLASGKRHTVVMTIGNTYAAGAHEDFSHFFDRFYRDDQSHHHGKKGGFGIGLSMADNLVRSFRGRITTAYHDGCIYFITTLPFANPGDPAKAQK